MTILGVSGYFILNLIMQFSRNLIDFWLQNQVSEDQSKFSFLNERFDDDFCQIFKFLIQFNLTITSIRMIFYVASS
jgi:hypothetical protein